MTLRRVLTIPCLAAIVVACLRGQILQMLFVDRTPISRALTLFPDGLWPQYPRFLEGVREHTKPGDTIAMVLPSMGWDYGYSYGYYRACYFLTGREVLPLVTPEDASLPQNFRAARYIAVFRRRLGAPADVVWQNKQGALLRLRQ